MNDVAPIVVPGPTGVSLITPALLVTEDREVAWEGAKRHIRISKDRAWIMGRFCHAGLPANENGHLFREDELVTAHKAIPHTPMNLLHRRHHVVGAYVASEMIFPTGETDAATDGVITADNVVPHPAALIDNRSPWVETLAVTWKYHFPDEFAMLRAAHDAGQSFQSMECVPPNITCPTCDGTFDYMGAAHDSYCDHVNVRKAPRWLNQPLFVAGGLIIPPARPGWKGAKIAEVAGLIEKHDAVASFVYDQIVATAGHLSAQEAEGLMAELIAGKFDERPERRLLIAPLWDRLTAGYDGIDFVPPTEVQAAAERAVEAADPDLGIEPVDLARAHALMRGDPRPPATVRRMAELDPIQHPVEWALAGASPGVEWARQVAGQMDLADQAVMDRKFTAEKRRDLAKKGHAMSDGSFPIENAGDLRNAIRLARTPAQRAHIIKRAKALGKSDMIPDGWSSSKDAVDAELVELAASADRTGVIVTFTPPADVVAKIVAMDGVTEPVDQIHCTVCFIGSLDSMDSTEMEDESGNTVSLERMKGAVAAAAAGFKPFSAHLGGIGKFPMPDGTECTYFSVDAPGLSEMRDRLVAALEAAGIDPSSQHGWTPHVTVSYAPAGEGPTEIPEQLAWTVDELQLWWGNTHETVEMRAGAVPA